MTKSVNDNGLTTDIPDVSTLSTDQKYKKLLEQLRSMGKVAVAFSGGVDSTFLLAAAKEAQVSDLVALTMKRPYIAEWELVEAEELIKKMGISFQLIEIPVDEEVRNNVVNRCYFCKSSTFKRFREEIDRMGYDVLLDGSNADDVGEYRPGLRALREQKVRSPLKELGLTKAEIRKLSGFLGLPTKDKASNTCLVTRIPYDTHISDEDLRQIEYAELYLMKEGFHEIRVRKHDKHARIEVDPDRVSELFEGDRMEHITQYFKSIGFENVSVDMGGYKTGNLDTAILKGHS